MHLIGNCATSTILSGRVILLSASVGVGADLAPGDKILLCESLAGSKEATQTDAFRHDRFSENKIWDLRQLCLSGT
jgi:hypothetical protein